VPRFSAGCFKRNDDQRREPLELLIFITEQRISPRIICVGDDCEGEVQVLYSAGWSTAVRWRQAGCGRPGGHQGRFPRAELQIMKQEAGLGRDPEEFFSATSCPTSPDEYRADGERAAK
jgi:hypothetical protein